MTRFLSTFFFIIIAINAVSQANLKKEKQLMDDIQQASTAVNKIKKQLVLADFYKETNIRKADSLAKVLVSSSMLYDDSIRLAALVFKADIELIKGNRSDYFTTTLGCQPFLNRVHTEQQQISILHHLGNYHLMLKEKETADFYIRRLLKLATSTNSKKDITKAHLLLAQNFLLNQQKDSALHHVEVAIQNARRISNRVYLTACFHQQASIYIDFEQLELGIAKNIVALQIATEIKDNRLISLLSLEIGKAQYSIHNIKEADYHFRQAFEHAKKVEDENLIAHAHLQLASILFSYKNYQQAINTSNVAINIFERLRNEEGLGSTYNLLGIIYREQGEYIKAGSQFNQALIRYESVGNMPQIANVYHNVGTVFYARKKFENALQYLNRSVEISKVYGPTNQVYSSYKVISNIYKDLGQSQKALEYMDKYVNHMDSSAIEQAIGKIAELNELYRAEQRNRLILSQSDSLERQRQEKQLTNAQLENVELRSDFLKYTIMGIGLIILLTSILLINRWNQNEIRQQQREAEMNQTLLRAQMNPHFVFNAMSVIQSYIYENDTENSSKFLVNFSRLMRLILENSSKEEIPITLEEEILQKYLGTQKLRFEDRFEFQINIAPELRIEKAMIPPMITQPFIENSIEHGQLHLVEGGFIHINFTKSSGMLVVTIEDNGVGRKGSEKNKKSRDHKSMAMNITYERINNLNKKYKTEGRLTVEDFDKNLQTGTKVLISLPYRTENQSI